MTLNLYMRVAYLSLVVWTLLATLNGFGADHEWWTDNLTTPIRVVGWVIVFGILVGEVLWVWRDHKTPG